MIRKDVQLLTTNNFKTTKGEKMGIKTFILYLSPYKDNSKGKNLCPKASVGCSKSCLFNSGNARFDRIQVGRRNKSEWYLSDRDSFMLKLVSEIETAIKKYSNDWILAIRLNGTSDIPYENIIVKDGKNIFQLFPKVKFYDYTKIANRFNKVLPKNYNLTFSRSETNENKAIELLNSGVNVAWVFDNKPKRYLGYKVVDGDLSDVRFKDKNGVIVGLTFKNATGKGAKELNDFAKVSGFVTYI